MYHIVGCTRNAKMIPTAFTIKTTKLFAGDIVQVDDQFYRVYEDGQKGLRFWNVTTKFQLSASLMKIDEELARREQARLCPICQRPLNLCSGHDDMQDDYDNTIADFEMMARGM